MKFTVDHAKKCLAVIDAGLVSGLGNPVPGQMCVEAAICYALDLPHGDDPGCVSAAVRSFKISLNDKLWSSNEARAKGLRALAVAQLGSKGVIDDREFVRRLAEKMIRQIMPIALRAVAGRMPSHAVGLEVSALACEHEGTRASALRARDAAYAAVHAADATASAAYAAASAYAAAAYADASAHAADAFASAAYAAASAAARDNIFAKAADIALDVLREMSAPGIALWDMVEAEGLEAEGLVG